MRKVFLALFAVLVAMSSCNKTEVGQDEMKGSINFELDMENQEENLKGGVAPGVLPVYVNELTLTATPANGNPAVTEVFKAELSSTVDKVTLDNVWYGTNTFVASTTPMFFDYTHEGHAGPIQQKIAALTGLSHINGSQVDPANGIFTVQESATAGLKTTAELATGLRIIPPYAIFNGSTTGVVDAFSPDATYPITMTTDYGRLILTFEFEHGPINYYAKLFVNGNDVGGYDQFFLASKRNAALYWSGPNAINDAELDLELKIYSSEDPDLEVNSFDLNSIPNNNFKVQSGKDKWVNIIVSEKAVRASDPSLAQFTWIWAPLDGGDVIIE